MFTKKDKTPSKLQQEVDRILTDLEELPLTSDRYDNCLDRVERLHKLEMAEKSSKKSVSPDTILVVATNLIGIGLILGHEKMNIITSKALGFVLKGRV